jgi:hypothetical protein
MGNFAMPPDLESKCQKLLRSTFPGVCRAPGERNVGPRRVATATSNRA